MSRRGWMILLYTALLGLAIGAWLYTKLEKKTTTITTAASAEARRNPLLAAHRFLEEMGIKVASVRGNRLINELPEAGDTLVLYRNRVPLTPPRLQALLDWVDQGGNIIMDVGQFWDTRRDVGRSALLDALHVTLARTDGEDDVEPVDVPLDGAEPVQVAFIGRYHMLAPEGGYSAALGNGQGGARLLQFERGNGTITLVDDLAFINNDHIGEYDHAFFLYWLADSGQKVWLLFNPYNRSLMDIVWQHGQPLLLSLLLLGAVIVWAGNVRLGRLVAAKGAARRDTTDHLVAQGNFDWTHGLAATRFRETQQRIEHRWLLHHPQLRAMDQAQRSAWIAEHTDEDPTAVRSALYETFDNPEHFVRLSALLQRLGQISR